LKCATQRPQNRSIEAGYKKSTPLAVIRKSLIPLRFTGKWTGRIFPISTEVPFWGFWVLTKKIVDFFLSQIVWI
jgi:hypothetical protein